MRHYLQTIHAWGQTQWVQSLAYAAWATLIVMLTAAAVKQRQRGERLTPRQRIGIWCLAIVVVAAAVLLYFGSSNDVFVLALSLAMLAPAYFLLQQLRSAPEHG